jgi:hypothetical protein
MQTIDNLYEYESNPKDRKLSDGLNVLTILTFIGSAYQLLKSISGLLPIDCEKQMDEIEKAMSGAQASGNTAMLEKVMSIMQGFMNVMCTNHVLISIVAIACAIMCGIGAYLMRQKKQIGFTIYAVGELVYPLMCAVLFGSLSYGWAYCIWMFLTPIIFMLLYAAKRKHLVL